MDYHGRPRQSSVILKANAGAEGSGLRLIPVMPRGTRCPFGLPWSQSWGRKRKQRRGRGAGVGFAVLLPSARGHRLELGQDLTGSAVPADVALLLSTGSE